MPRLEVEEVLRRHRDAEADGRNWDQILRDAYEFGLPQRDVMKTQTAGVRKGDRVFDSTAPTAVIDFANRIQSDLMPTGQRWVTLEPGPRIPEEIREEAKARLEFVNEQLFAVLHASNFDTANNEVLLDLAVGTGAMLVLEGDPARHPVMYIPVPTSTIDIDEGPWGTVDGVFRKWSVRYRNLRKQWPDIGNLPEELVRRGEENPNMEVDLTEASYQDQRDEDVWYYDVFVTADKQRVVERQYKTRPWVVPRWVKVAGEVRGRGPLVQAMADIKTLNKLVELVLMNAALHVSGLWTGVAGNTFNPATVAIVPGAVIPVDSNNSRGPSLQPLERTGTFDVAFLEREKLETNIRRYLLADRLPPMEGTVRSATEIIERIKELARDIGAPFGRLFTEYIVPLIQRTLDIMERQGIIPKVQVDGLHVKAQVVSPLAREQNLSDIQTVVQWVQIIQQLGGGPELAILGIAMERLPGWLGNKFGVPNELMRTEDESKQIEQAAGLLVQQRMANAAQLPQGDNVVPLQQPQQQLQQAA